VNEPLALALLSDAAVARALSAGFEEEGVPLTVEVRGAAGVSPERWAHAEPSEILAHEAAMRSLLGVGIGGDADRLAVILAGAPRQRYLQAPATAARRLGQDAARIAARRPLKLG
jgi:hypothetical protein